MIRRKKTGGVNPLVQLVVLLVAIALLGLLAYRQYVRLGHAKKPVVVTATALPEGAIIQPKHVQILQIQEKNIPEGAFVRAGDVIGKKVTRAKAKGEPIATSELQAANAEASLPLSKVIPAGRVLTSLTLLNPTIPYQSFNRGDRVDVLVASTSSNRLRKAQVVASDVYIVGFTQPKAAAAAAKRNILGIDMSVPTLDEMAAPRKEETALLLAVKPLDVIPLASIDGISSMRVILVLHGDEEVKKGEMLAIERPAPPPMKTVDVIVGVNRQKVSVP